MRAPLTFVGEKNRKVTAVYPANDSQSCTCKLNLGQLVAEIALKNRVLKKSLNGTDFEDIDL